MSNILLLFAFILPKDTLPPVADLYASLQTYHLSQTKAQLAEFQESGKGEWLKYIPSVGLTYTVAGQPRPSVSFSTSLIYNVRKGKQLRAAKSKSIQETQILLLQDAESELTRMLGNYYNELEGLQFAEEIQKIDDQIFAIDQDKYQKLEIKPSQFLAIRRAYLTKQYQLTEKRKAIRQLERDIIFVSKFKTN